MQEILAQQRNAAKPVTGRGFLLGVIGVIIRLSVAQIVVNLCIMASGVGLLNIVFYLYAIWVIVSFMGKTVAGSLYMLKDDALYLQKTLGDSTVSVTEIPLEAILGVRSVVYADRLESSYRRVTVIDAAAAKPFSIRMAEWLSLFSARLARWAAGEKARAERGMVVAYMEEEKRCCCVFLPNETFCAALEQALPEVFGVDERTQENTPVTMSAQALERAFPDLYTHTQKLVNMDDAAQAKEEIRRQKRTKAKGKAGQNAKHDKAEALELTVETKAVQQEDTQEETVDANEVQDDTL